MDERARFRAAFAARLGPPDSDAPLVGRLTAVQGNQLRAALPDAEYGATVQIERRDAAPLLAEVVGFSEAEVVLLPYDDPAGMRPGAAVTRLAVAPRAPDAHEVLGRVIDPFGRALEGDEQFALVGGPLRAAAPSPLERKRVEEPLHTGLRVLDGLIPLGVGQRVGLFAGSGVGKSVLLNQLTRGVKADACVVALVGERGREVGEFVDDLGQFGRSDRTTVVVATSDAPPLARIRAALTATALAEQWRAEGAHCLLLVDSLTRYARALREAALAAGEPPARRGYPASVFAALPRLLERSGPGASGAISAVYTVLVDGGDLEEPVADEVRGIVDGHIVLTRALAEKGHFPAVDVLKSVSRVASRVLNPTAQADVRDVREALALLERHHDAIDLGIYQFGTDRRIDTAIEQRAAIEAFLQQRPDEICSIETTRHRLADIAQEVGR